VYQRELQLFGEAAIERFVDGREHCVVTVDDDPAQHRFFFLPAELEKA
jgi:hypothetical protein